MKRIVDYVGAVSATYFTDPFCPWSWAVEPHLRRLAVEFGEQVRLTFVIVGLAANLQEPGRAGSLALAALDAGEASGMPVDPRVFLRHPPRSTHPAGIAVTAAAEQGDPGPYLRRLREAILLERRPMDSPDGLLDAAREAGGLDVDRLRLAFGSNAVLEAFGAHIERARAVDTVRHEPGAGRVEIPSVEFRGEDGEVRGVYGYAAYEVWREAALAAGAEAQGAAPPDPVSALERFGVLTTPEVAAVCELPWPRAAAELWRLALEWRVRPRRVLGGELWAPA